MSFLTLKQVTKRFGKTLAVHNIDLEIEEGEILCLLGPSGCGKTTLLRLIAGLETADAGQMRFKGANLLPFPPHLRDFGMMFQSFALFPHLNVEKNISFGLELKGMAQPDIEQRVQEMLALVDLRGHQTREIDQLSGGEQQRVALARSLATRPQLLLLDEPLGALDRALRERLMLDLRRIIKEVGVTAISVTHDQAEAYALADRIAVMDRGRIAQIAPPEELYESPNSPYVARFIGFENVIDGEALDGRPGTVLIKPDGLLTQLPDEEDALILLGEVDQVVFRGNHFQVWFNTPLGRLQFELPERPDVLQTQWYLRPNAIQSL